MTKTKPDPRDEMCESCGHTHRVHYDAPPNDCMCAGCFCAKGKFQREGASGA